MASFEDRVALVTGAGRGIGREIAHGLAAQGRRVALLARSREQLDAVAAEIKGDGGSAVAVVADVGDHAQLRTAVDQVTTQLDAVEVLVNNAAPVWPLGPTPDLDPQAVADALAINVTHTAMQEWIRAQPPEQVGATLHEWFTTMHAEGSLLTARQSASALLARLEQFGSGEIWNVDTPSQDT